MRGKVDVGLAPASQNRPIFYVQEVITPDMISYIQDY